jgi:Flp pilus assembly protein TadG
MSRRTSRRGAAILYIVMALPVLLGIASLAVDFGRIHAARGELQAAVDAALIYGARGIADGTAFAKAVIAAGENRYDGNKPLTLSGSEVQVGSWNSTTKAFTAGASPANALQITVSRTIPLTLLQAFGVTSRQIAASGITTMNQTFASGFVGLDWVDVNSGGTSDSYDSSKGAYSAATAGNLGSLASNGWIKINSSTIKKDVYMRSGQTLDADGSSYGQRINMASAMSVPLPSASPYSSSNNSNGNITPQSAIKSNLNFNSDGSTVTMPGGNYYFNSFTTNSTTLNVTGPSTLYVNGDLAFNSTTLNVTSQRPGDFRIIVVKASPVSISFNSVTGLCADIQAPTASVELNSTTTFFGRIIAKTLKVNSSAALHYDVSLPPIPGATLPRQQAISAATIVK